MRESYHSWELLEVLEEVYDLELVLIGVRRDPRAPARPPLFCGADGLPTNLRGIDSLRLAVWEVERLRLQSPPTIQLRDATNVGLTSLLTSTQLRRSLRVVASPARLPAVEKRLLAE